jgi:hypothetical protein
LQRNPAMIVIAFAAFCRQLGRKCKTFANSTALLILPPFLWKTFFNRN